MRTPSQIYEYTKAARDAKNFMTQTSTMDRYGRLKPLLSATKRPAVVFDIDETLFQTHCWNCGHSLEDVIPINPIKNFYKWCVDQNIAVFLVTARTVDNKEYTFKELVKNGVGKFANMFMMPETTTKTVYQVQTFKSNARKLVSQKFTILANFGDQAHDIRGSPTREKERNVPKEGECYSLRGYLLPDPITPRKCTMLGTGTPVGVGFQYLGKPRTTKDMKFEGDERVVVKDVDENSKSPDII